MKIRFYPTDATYKVTNEAPAIHLFGKTAEGEQVCVIDQGFEPYFWIITRDNEAALSICSTREGRQTRPKRVETHTKRYIGREVTAQKIFAHLPSDIPLLREEAAKIGRTLEADIPFSRRYLIDKNITPLTLCEAEGGYTNQGTKTQTFRAESITRLEEETMQDIKILALDIETHCQLGTAITPDHQPIIMLALAGKDLRKVITWKKFKTDLDYIEFVDSEMELIERFKQAIDEYKPDMVTGYYSDGFDLPYISARAQKYRISLNIGLDNSELRITKKNNQTAEITGIPHFDIFIFIKKIMGRTMETTTYDLDSVSGEILLEKKDKVDLGTLYHAWENNTGLEEFCRYNLQDANLALKLSNQLLPNLIELVKIVGLTPQDVNRMAFSQLVEWYLINQAKNFNELVPNKPAYTESRQRIETTYEGAYVYEPTPGLYKDITVFDFRSLYPTIISAHNISPDTLNCQCCTKETGTWFCTRRKGFISTVIENLITRRIRIKEIMKATEKNRMLKAREEALKTIANSMYGYMGFFGARWYSIACATSITSYGRNYITSVIKRAQDKGFKVLYSDTDSIFLSLDGKKKEDATDFANEINKNLPGLMELDYEGYYPTGLFVATKESGEGAKKKYALLSENGNIKIKGFEAVRRNLSKIAKEAQERTISIILKENDREKATEYIRETVNALRQRTIPAEKTIISTQLQKDVTSYDAISPHVAVAQKMIQQGKTVATGSVISYIVTAGKDRIRERAKPPSEVKGNEYDPEYYINNQILPSVKKIFDVLGIDIILETEPKTQKKLDAFFG